jgi:DHA1 family inner membrane transport protein
MNRPVPRHILPVLVLAQFLGTSLWFAVNAVMPDLQSELGWPTSAVGTLTSALQFGFIAGTLVFALLAIADRFSARQGVPDRARWPARRCARWPLRAMVARLHCALLAVARGHGLLPGGHLPGGHEDRLAVVHARAGHVRWAGCIGALVLGSCQPACLLRALSGASLPWPSRVLRVWRCWPPRAGAGGGAASPTRLVRAGACTTLRLARAGQPVARRARAGSVLRLLRPHVGALHRVGADAAGAGHAAAGRGVGVGPGLRGPGRRGAMGCVRGGLLAPRFGSARVAGTQLATSGACAAWPRRGCWGRTLPRCSSAWLVLWGVTVAGDSPQFSATDGTPTPLREAVGSVLTLTNSIGFAISALSIELFVRLSATQPLAALLPWLALGPALGLLALRPLWREDARAP